MDRKLVSAESAKRSADKVRKVRRVGPCGWVQGTYLLAAHGPSGCLQQQPSAQALKLSARARVIETCKRYLQLYEYRGKPHPSILFYHHYAFLTRSNCQYSPEGSQAKDALSRSPEGR